MVDEMNASVTTLFQLSKSDNFSAISDLMNQNYLDLLRKVAISRNAFAWAMNGEEPSFMLRMGDYSLPNSIEIRPKNLRTADFERLEACPVW